VQDTSPELQHEFCALWNEMVREARIGLSKIPQDALRPIHNIYIALHQSTNSAPTRFSPSTGDVDPILFNGATYPLCHVSGHEYNGSASTTFGPVPHDGAVMSPTSLAGPVAPSSPLPTPFHVDNSLTTVPAHDNSYATHETIENACVPVTSPDQATAGGTREAVTLGITTPLRTPEMSTSSPHLLSTSLPASVPSQHCPTPLEQSCPPNLPSSASSNSALDHILHAGPSLSLMTPSGL
jgi:hypothetical protein